MPVRIEQQRSQNSLEKPHTLINHFESNVDGQGKIHHPNTHEIEDSIRHTVSDFLDKEQHFVIANVHPQASLNQTGGILFRKEAINALVNHENLVGLAVVESSMTALHMVVELAQRLRPGLVVPLFRTIEEATEYIPQAYEFYKSNKRRGSVK